MAPSRALCLHHHFLGCWCKGPCMANHKESQKICAIRRSRQTLRSWSSTISRTQTMSHWTRPRRMLISCSSSRMPLVWSATMCMHPFLFLNKPSFSWCTTEKDWLSKINKFITNQHSLCDHFTPMCSEDSTLRCLRLWPLNGSSRIIKGVVYLPSPFQSSDALCSTNPGLHKQTQASRRCWTSHPERYVESPFQHPRRLVHVLFACLKSRCFCLRNISKGKILVATVHVQESMVAA